MPKNGGSIVLIEDDASQRRVMQHSLEEAGYTVYSADNARDGLMNIRSINPRLVITDICLGDSSGLELLTEVKACRKDILVLVVTGYSSLEQAVEAIRLGAFDYIPKPFNRDQLLLAVYKALAFEGLRRENNNLKAALVRKGRRMLLGDSHGMHTVHDLIKRMSRSCAPVLILGESGTGKELAARLLHNQSDCGKGPFVAVNCAAIPAPLLESELFGHVRGSFTGATHDSKGKFEQAEGGTLFLDEVGELPLDLQPKLLRALQEQEITPVGGSVKSVNTRIIAATNRNLEERVEQGLFRSDLYYRLAVLLLTLPALRERSEDIILLAQHFLSRHAEGRNLQFSSEAIELLQNYSWPGNVRELENLIHRLAVLARRELIEKEDLPRHIQICNKSHEPLVVYMPMGGFSLRSIECQAIKQALIASDGNRSKAAEFLEIPRHILAYRIKKFGIDDFESKPVN